MSAVEIIEEFNKLSREEREKVADYVRKSEPVEKSSGPSVQISEEFKRIADEVFTTNAELFRKLAQ